MPPAQEPNLWPCSEDDQTCEAHVCRHLFCGDVFVDKLHFLTGFQKNILHQMTSGDFSMKKSGQPRPLALIRNSFNSSGWWSGFT